MKDFILPDWKNSNLNISATLAEFLGAPNKNATLPIIEKELQKKYKNVVFICFDGMGIYPLNQNLESDDFLQKHIALKLVSTFPSTTTNATTSLLTNTYPLEHGWFGWSMHFPSLQKNVDIFLGKDSWTGEKLEIKESPLGELNYYFDNVKTDYKINTIFPDFVKVKNQSQNNVFSNQDEFFDYIYNICNRGGKQFIYAYFQDPDATMHEFGVTSSEAKNVITSISKKMEWLYNNTKDTLFIVSADHGQIDVEGYTNIYDDKEIMDMLEINPYLEARAGCFKVKPSKMKDFEKTFNDKYSKDFILYKTKDLIKDGYFGPVGDKGYLLGDYIAIGTYTHKQLCLTPKSHKFKGHHTSLTEEMEIPLIIIENKT